MTSAAQRLATYEDLVALPDGVRGEVIAGSVVVTPSPSPEHQLSLGLVAADLIGAFQRGRGGPGGWWIVPDVDVRSSRCASSGLGGRAPRSGA
jgi:hypothetical protein